MVSPMGCLSTAHHWGSAELLHCEQKSLYELRLSEGRILEHVSFADIAKLANRLEISPGLIHGAAMNRSQRMLPIVLLAFFQVPGSAADPADLAEQLRTLDPGVVVLGPVRQQPLERMLAR